MLQRRSYPTNTARLASRVKNSSKATQLSGPNRYSHGMLRPDRPGDPHGPDLHGLGRQLHSGLAATGTPSLRQLRLQRWHSEVLWQHDGTKGQGRRLPSRLRRAEPVGLRGRQTTARPSKPAGTRACGVRRQSMSPARTAAIWMVLIIACLSLFGLAGRGAWSLLYPPAKAIPEVVKPRPAERQVDGSLVLMRTS